ncbi:MAG: hypothetical protein IJF47_06580 [Candidatus Methanomethylophilaceae archaeon]|nr:hypothetical protein [Thermoplasmata archaeon]MBQ2763351.1 hypothetical protein [Candidatus Methanomethylophilaceae archaeon]
MRFAITRLCGGKALMCASRDILDLDMDKARSVLSELGPIKVDDDMMLVSEWGEMEITLYPQGKVMFHPLSEKEKAVEYATEILNKIL